MTTRGETEETTTVGMSWMTANPVISAETQRCSFAGTLRLIHSCHQSAHRAGDTQLLLTTDNPDQEIARY
eukprot:scaffold719_cov117-Cylindrotheca_fusiformis.AAC.2